MNSELVRLVIDRRFWTGTWVWVALLLGAVNVGVYAWSKQAAQEQKQKIQADFQIEQVLYAASDAVPRYDCSCGENLEAFWSSIPDGRQTRLAILSGMSQMHTVNDGKLGDKLICQMLDDALQQTGTRVWGFAAPNLCNEEAVFQLVSLLSDPAKHPRYFIYGICFDKMRNIDLRVGYQRFLRDHPEIVARYEDTARQYDATYPLAAAKMRETLADIAQSAAQKSDSLESRLRDTVGDVVPLVKARKDLYVWSSIQMLLLRNHILGIKTDSKRPVIRSRYDMNFEFLRMLTDIAHANGVQPIFYVIPLNPQGDNPYVASEYESFKKDIRAYCVREKIPFDNFENRVPAEDWGTLLGGPDFKHFKENGHKKTAAAILESFGTILSGRETSEVWTEKAAP
jgi:hypothetical protein